MIEGRWTAIREVLTGQGKMRHTHTERIVKEIFLFKMQAICQPGNLTNFLGPKAKFSKKLLIIIIIFNTYIALFL